jgi:cytochrome P450
VGVIPDARDWIAFISRMQREYGDLVYYRFLSIPVCYVNRPDYIEEILITKYHNFHKSKDYRALRPWVGSGLLTSEGEFWRRQRRLAQPAFHRERIAAYGRLMVEHTERMLQGWQAGETRDIHREMMQLTLGIVAAALFSSDVEAIAADVGRAVQRLMEQYLARLSTAFLIPEIIPTPGNLRAREARLRLDKIIYGIIRARRSVASNPVCTGNGAHPDDLLSMLLAARDEDGAHMTDKQLRDELMTLFLGGHETTSNALAWTWYLLAKHPEVESKLWAELTDVLKGLPPSVNQLNRLLYTEKVIKESLRLYPPAWGIGRQAIKDFEIGGYRIPAGTNVFASQWLMHHDGRYYPEPARFNPDRWTDEFMRQLPKFAYFPFGGGPRVCIGASFAMLEATLLLATIAQRFRLALVPGHSVEPLASLTLRPKNGIKVTLSKR